MANFTSRRLKDLSILSIAVILVQIALAKWVYPMFGTGLQQLYSITPQTAITSPTIGSKILGFVTGIVPVDFGNLTSLLVLFLGAFVLLFVGYSVYEQRWAWKGRNIYQRLWAILLYGTLTLYAILLVTQWSAVSVIALPLLLGLGINYLIVAFVVSTAAKYFSPLRI